MTVKYEMGTVWRAVGELSTHPDNPRIGDVSAIAESLRANGQYRPIVTTTNGTILAGNHTFKAAKSLGYPKVACVVLDIDPLSPEARRIMAADNRTAELGTYNPESLLALLKGLSDLDELVGSGYTESDIDELIIAMSKGESPWENRDIIDLNDSDLESGSRWLLGDGVLVCGDSSDPETWKGAPMFDGIVTDPPYGVAYTGGTTKRRPDIENDGDPEIAAQIFSDAIDAIPFKPGAIVYVFSAYGGPGIPTLKAMYDRGIARSQLIWVKHRANFGRSDYHAQHEPVYYGWFPNGPHLAVNSRKLTTVFEAKRANANNDHPTEKPVEVIDRLVSAHDWPKDAVLVDPFAGSGTLMEVCINRGVGFWVVEKEPSYCDVILERYKRITGKDPVPL